MLQLLQELEPQLVKVSFMFNTDFYKIFLCSFEQVNEYSVFESGRSMGFDLSKKVSFHDY